jgi:hypothetical protein
MRQMSNGNTHQYRSRKEKEGMNTYRSNAIIAGVLYIIGTVAGILSLALSQPVRAVQDSLAGVAANANQVIVATLFVLLMGLSLAMVPVVLYPILRRYNEVLALGYVVFRGALETVTYFVTAISWLLLLALGQLYVQAGALAASGFQASAALLLKAGEIKALPGIVFCLGALMFYAVLYQDSFLAGYQPGDSWRSFLTWSRNSWRCSPFLILYLQQRSSCIFRSPYRKWFWRCG